MAPAANTTISDENNQISSSNLTSTPFIALPLGLTCSFRTLALVFTSSRFLSEEYKPNN